MALYSFGGVSDQCGATSWVVQETGMLPLFSCDIDVTAWLKDKQKGLGVTGEEEEDLVMPKLQVIQNISQLKLLVYIQVVTWIGLSSNATVWQWKILAGLH